MGEVQEKQWGERRQDSPGVAHGGWGGEVRVRKKGSGRISNIKWLPFNFSQRERNRCADVVLRIPSITSKGRELESKPRCGLGDVCPGQLRGGPCGPWLPVCTRDFMDMCLRQTFRPDCLHSIATMYNYLLVLAKGVSLAFLAEGGWSLIFEGIFFRQSALAFVRALRVAWSSQTYWLTH